MKSYGFLKKKKKKFLVKHWRCTPSYIVFTTKKFVYNLDTQVPEMGGPPTNFKHGGGKNDCGCHWNSSFVFSTTAASPCLVVKVVHI